jgi:succinate dehydrogenase / fumarate reductase, iron-sulfur subunit
MPEYLLKIRRYDPNSGQAAYWDEHPVELDGSKSVLDAILKVRDEVDGSVGIRCSCQQAICGSCGVRVNGKPGLACNTHLDEAADRRHGAGWNSPSGDEARVIEVEPMGNMPVIKDLIVDMDAVHWKKIQRVTPYLINQQPVPEREYIVPHENMVDVTQTMACIQCGACVSDCLSMEIDPGFIGPAALSKAYRFVGDPRDADQFERLKDLAEDEHGLYDCTHCFNCIDACPKGVDPMSQIMRLRRRAGTDEEISDRNNGSRHEEAFSTLVRDYGLLNEAELLPRSWGGNSWFGKFHPAAGKVLLKSLPAIIPAALRGKVSPKIAMFGHKLAPDDMTAIKKIFAKVEGREQRIELNLYVSGDDSDDDPPPSEPGVSSTSGAGDAATSPAAVGGSSDGAPADKSPTFPGPGEGTESASSESESA